MHHFTETFHNTKEARGLGGVLEAQRHGQAGVVTREREGNMGERGLLEQGSNFI